MANQYWLFQLQCVHYRQYVFSKSVGHVVRGCISRRPESAARDSIDMGESRELRREVIKNMCGIPAASQQENRSALATPIEHFQSDSVIDSYELNVMGRRVGPRALLGKQRTRKANEQCETLQRERYPEHLGPPLDSTQCQRRMFLKRLETINFLGFSALQKCTDMEVVMT